MYLSWDAMGDDTTGDAAQVGSYADKTVQFAGTWGGATAVLEGSMDGTTWFTLTDYQGAAISATADANDSTTWPSELTSTRWANTLAPSDSRPLDAASSLV